MNCPKMEGLSEFYITEAAGAEVGKPLIRNTGERTQVSLKGSDSEAMYYISSISGSL